MRIVEHYSPIEDLLRRFPILARLEKEMFERVLNCPVRREEQLQTGRLPLRLSSGLSEADFSDRTSQKHTADVGNARETSAEEAVVTGRDHQEKLTRPARQMLALSV